MLALVGFFLGGGFLGQLGREVYLEHRLRAVVGYGGVAVSLLGGFLQGLYQLDKHLPGKRPAPPVEDKRQAFLRMAICARFTTSSTFVKDSLASR